MRYIKELSELLPIQCNNNNIILLNLKYMDNYIDILLEDYYNEYLDFGFSKMNREKLQESLYNKIISFKFKVETPYEARLIYINKNNEEIIGGCTIIERDTNTLELAYFIVPKYQHNNEAYKMMKSVIDRLNNSKIPFKELMVTIQKRNDKSIRLAKNLGFIEKRIVKGRYCDNIIMKLERSV